MKTLFVFLLVLAYTFPVKAQEEDVPLRYLGDGKWETTTEWVRTMNEVLEEYNALLYNYQQVVKQNADLTLKDKNSQQEIENYKKVEENYKQMIDNKDEVIAELLSPKVITTKEPFLKFDYIGLDAGLRTDWKENLTFDSVKKFVSGEAGIILGNKLRIRLNQELPINTTLKFGVIF